MDNSGTLWLPPANSTTAGYVDPIWDFVMWSSVVFFVLVVAVMVIFAVRYRRRDSDVLTTSNDHNFWLEVTWTVIPTILVLIVFVWGFRSYLGLQIAPKDALEVKVTAQKWFWSFDYASGGNTVNELVVPVDKAVRLIMSSRDVIHSFYVPNFRVKMDVLPNRYTTAWFQATSVGEYNLFCTEYCGQGHSEMLAKVKVLPESEYNKWLESSSGQGEGLSLEEFGAQLYKSRACVTCHTIDGGRLVGPTFKDAYGRTELLASGERQLVDDNYIRESILNPRAKIVNGYDPVMPTYQGILKDRQVDALVAYIKSLSK